MARRRPVQFPVSPLKPTRPLGHFWIEPSEGDLSNAGRLRISVLKVQAPAKTGSPWTIQGVIIAAETETWYIGTGVEMSFSSASRSGDTKTWEVDIDRTTELGPEPLASSNARLDFGDLLS